MTLTEAGFQIFVSEFYQIWPNLNIPVTLTDVM